MSENELAKQNLGCLKELGINQSVLVILDKGYPLIEAFCLIELKAIIAFACLIAFIVSSKLPSTILIIIAVGFPLFVITTSPSDERLSHTLLGIFFKSLTVQKFISILLIITTPCCNTIINKLCKALLKP